jgi:hypothetical protein
MSAPIEAKVKTATAATAVTAFVLGLVQQFVFKGGEVPEFVSAFVTSAVGSTVAGAVTFVVGWLTKHTSREVLDIQENREW